MAGNVQFKRAGRGKDGVGNKEAFRLCKEYWAHWWVNLIQRAEEEGSSNSIRALQQYCDEGTGMTGFPNSRNDIGYPCSRPG